jgi:hypothetical protein
MLRDFCELGAPARVILPMKACWTGTLSQQGFHLLNVNVAVAPYTTVNNNKVEVETIPLTNNVKICCCTSYHC